MNKSIFSGTTAFLLGALFASSAYAGDDEDTKLYGSHDGRMTLQLFRQSGDENGRTIAAVPPATVATPATGFSRLGAGVGVDGGGFFDKTLFKTLVGFEGSAFLGYTQKPKYDQNPPNTAAPKAGSLMLRADGGPSYALLNGNWGRVTLLPGIGFSLDGGRLHGSYAYAYLGVRGSLVVSKDLDVSVQFVRVPGTTLDSAYIRENRFEAFANYSSVTVGARLQIDSAIPTSGGEKTYTTMLSGLVGYAF